MSLRVSIDVTSDLLERLALRTTGLLFFSVNRVNMPNDIRSFFGGKPSGTPAAKPPPKEEKPKKGRKAKVVEESDDDDDVP